MTKRAERLWLERRKAYLIENLVPRRKADTGFPAQPAPTTEGSAGGTGSASAAPPAGAAQKTLPDAAAQGFLTYQGAARCRGVDPAALIVRTPYSAAVSSKPAAPPACP